MSVITLTTDFGTRDWFVGTMKGGIVGLAPGTTVVDLTHDLPPGDIRGGAFVLAAGCRFFPKGAVHLAVVDPGVGSGRKAIAVQTDKAVFVGPDNGVLSWALAKERIRAIHGLENEAFFLQPVSRTFHGRDVFAPVAAHLSRGVPIQKFGPALKDFVRLAWPEARVRRGGVEGEVVYIDRFGNAITNLEGRLLGSALFRSDLLTSHEPPKTRPSPCPLPATRGEGGRRPGEGRFVESSGRASCEVYAKRRWNCPLKAFYQAVASKKPVALVGSSGYLEIAINGGSAAKVLGVSIGTRVVLRAGLVGRRSR